MEVVVPRSLTITKVTASVQVNYPAVGDLNVYLYSPLRTRTRIGGDLRGRYSGAFPYQGRRG
jgi:subtilisin-like proprotein convertase family protein